MKMNPDWHVRTPDDDRDYDAEEDRKLEIADHEILKYKCEEEEMQENEMQAAVAVIEKQAILKVASVQERNSALDLVKQIKSRRSAVVEFFRDTKAKANAAWKAIVAQEKSFTDRLDNTERKIKMAVLEFDREQERVRQAEQRRLQAAADEAARRERERLEKQAAKLKTPEKREAVLEQAAMVAAPAIQVAPAVQKTTGVSTRKTWKARVVDVEKVPREFMVVNQQALDAYARATKGAVAVAGVEFVEEETMSIRK